MRTMNKTTMNTTHSSDFLSFLSNEERQEIISTANDLIIKEPKRITNKAVKQYRDAIKKFIHDKKSTQAGFYYGRQQTVDLIPPPSYENVSHDGMKRIYYLLNEIFTALEKLNCTIDTQNMSLLVRGEKISLEFLEAKDTVNHELTKDEAKALVEYNDKIKNGSTWATKPRIRKYDKIFNGKLRIITKSSNYPQYKASVKDLQNVKLEDKLDEIIYMIFETAEQERQLREARKEKERIAEERRRKAKELAEKRESTIEKLELLENIIEDFRFAKDLREYANILSTSNANKLSEWIHWVKDMADWYDPTIAREDEVLGVRDFKNPSKYKNEHRIIRLDNW